MVEWPEEGPLGYWIFAEGFATQLTAELLPEYSLAEHLWFAAGYESWIAGCDAVLDVITGEIRDRLDLEEEINERRYLLNTDEHPDVPVRIGYYVGVLAVRELRQRYEWRELARWSPERALSELREVLTRPWPASPTNM